MTEGEASDQAHQVYNTSIAAATNFASEAIANQGLSESDWSKRTRNNYVSTFSTLFLFARDRDYCSENPGQVPRAILNDAAPGILTAEEAADLLHIARTEDPEMLAYVCIGLFAGLRRSELCALEWPEIDLQARTIEVKGVKAKRASGAL